MSVQVEGLEMGDATVFTTIAAHTTKAALDMVIHLTGIPASNIRSFKFLVGELVVEELERTDEGSLVLREDKQDVVIHERHFHMPCFTAVE
jgi:hypothetical protein